MEIPPKVRIPLRVEQGSVFIFYIDFGDAKRQSKNRYFVVLSQEPKTDTALTMVTSTTQISKKFEYVTRMGISEKTIVEITAKEYSVFGSSSCFNCNDVFEVSLRDLIRKVEENGSDNYPKMPSHLLLKLIDGVKTSPRVPEELKKMI